MTQQLTVINGISFLPDGNPDAIIWGYITGTVESTEIGRVFLETFRKVGEDFRCEYDDEIRKIYHSDFWGVVGT